MPNDPGLIALGLLCVLALVIRGIMYWPIWGAMFDAQIEPEISDVKVTAGGSPLPCHLDPNSGAVVVDGKPPVDGENIVITYLKKA